MENKQNMPVFSVEFGGKPEEVSATTFLASINSINGIFAEVSQREPIADRLQLTIKANRPGCFIADLGISEITNAAMAAAPVLLKAESIKSAYSIIKYIYDLFNLRKFLKKDEPVKKQIEGDEIKIENSQGSTIIVNKNSYNFYTDNNQIHRLLDKNFSALKEDENIEKFILRDNNEKQVFLADREEFKELISGLVNDQDDQRIITEKAMLHVIKPSFEIGLSWKFLYHSRRTGMKMSDEDFLNKVDKGEEGFKKGDVLDADIRITQKLDPNLMAYEDKDYEVVKVHNHIHAPENKKLFLSDRNEDDSD